MRCRATALDGAMAAVVTAASAVAIAERRFGRVLLGLGSREEGRLLTMTGSQLDLSGLSTTLA